MIKKIFFIVALCNTLCHIDAFETLSESGIKFYAGPSSSREYHLLPRLDLFRYITNITDNAFGSRQEGIDYYLAQGADHDASCKVYVHGCYHSEWLLASRRRVDEVPSRLWGVADHFVALFFSLKSDRRENLMKFFKRKYGGDIEFRLIIKKDPSPIAGTTKDTIGESRFPIFEECIRSQDPHFVKAALVAGLPFNFSRNPKKEPYNTLLYNAKTVEMARALISGCSSLDTLLYDNHDYKDKIAKAQLLGAPTSHIERIEREFFDMQNESKANLFSRIADPEFSPDLVDFYAQYITYPAYSLCSPIEMMLSPLENLAMWQRLYADEKYRAGFELKARMFLKYVTSCEELQSAQEISKQHYVDESTHNRLIGLIEQREQELAKKEEGEVSFAKKRTLED